MVANFLFWQNQANFLFGYKARTTNIVLVTTKEKRLSTNRIGCQYFGQIKVKETSTKRKRKELRRFSFLCIDTRQTESSKVRFQPCLVLTQQLELREITGLYSHCKYIYHTASSDTIFVQIYMDALPGVPGVSKNQNFFFTNKTVEFLRQNYP